MTAHPVSMRVKIPPLSLKYIYVWETLARSMHLTHLGRVLMQRQPAKPPRIQTHNNYILYISPALFKWWKVLSLHIFVSVNEKTLWTACSLSERSSIHSVEHLLEGTMQPLKLKVSQTFIWKWLMLQSTTTPKFFTKLHNCAVILVKSKRCLQQKILQLSNLYKWYLSFIST